MLFKQPKEAWMAGAATDKAGLSKLLLSTIHIFEWGSENAMVAPELYGKRSQWSDLQQFSPSLAAICQPLLFNSLA